MFQRIRTRRAETGKSLYTDRIKPDVAFEKRLHLWRLIALPTQCQLMVGDEPLIGYQVTEILEHYVDTDRVYYGREYCRYIDIRQVGHWRLLRERCDDCYVVAARS